MEILGARHIHTTAYHIKLSCRAFLLPTKNNLEVSTNTSKWVSALPLALLGIHTALKQDLRCSVAELVYTEPLSIHQESSLCPIKVQAQLILPVVMLPNT